ncbi:MAG: hypothetical protein WC492_03235 [Candidatus Micrarchaeia archaeon]
MTQLTIAEKLFTRLGEEPVSFNKLCRSSHLHPKTVKKYLEIIDFIQHQSEVKSERVGFRILIHKERKLDAARGLYKGTLGHQLSKAGEIRQRLFVEDD